MKDERRRVLDVPSAVPLAYCLILQVVTHEPVRDVSAVSEVAWVAAASSVPLLNHKRVFMTINCAQITAQLRVLKSQVERSEKMFSTDFRCDPPVKAQGIYRVIPFVPSLV